MPKWQIEPIAYHSDSTVIVDALLDMPWPVFLDSCQPHSHQGRFDIISTSPYVRLLTQGDSTQVLRQSVSESSTLSPFELIELYMPEPCQAAAQNLPFQGGALGYLAYDIARRVESIPTLAKRVIDLPDMAIGIYDWAIIVDHQEKKTVLFAANNDNNTVKTIAEVKQRLSMCIKLSNDFSLITSMQSNTSRTQYDEAFHTIKAHLSAGDCYQVNYSHCFSANFTGCPWQAYKQLRLATPVPHAAFMRIEQGDVLSLSPERFLFAEQDLVETKPVKGTLPRGKNANEDKALADALVASEKDWAENTMIVDLMRNDLGRVCQAGSISVPKLCALESFPAVHHLVSTVRGRLRSDKSLLQLLAACFPGGSVVGAPKCRVMEIIESLELQRRALYCGSLAYISSHGRLDSSIAIRSLMAVKNTIYCSAGGGIVYDSDNGKEYQETLDKIKPISRCLDSTCEAVKVPC